MAGSISEALMGQAKSQHHNTSAPASNRKILNNFTSADFLNTSVALPLEKHHTDSPRGEGNPRRITFVVKHKERTKLY